MSNLGHTKVERNLKGMNYGSQKGLQTHRNSVRQETFSALFYNITEALNPMSFSFKTLLYICI